MTLVQRSTSLRRLGVVLRSASGARCGPTRGLRDGALARSVKIGSTFVQTVNEGVSTMQLLTGTIPVQSYESVAAMRSNYSRLRESFRPKSFDHVPTKPILEITTLPAAPVKQLDETPKTPLPIIEIPNFLTGQVSAPYPTIDEILRVVCRRFTICRSDILSRTRVNSIIIPRHIAIYLYRSLSHKSFPEIGRRFRRDHTTCLFAYEKIKCEIQIDGDLERTVIELRSEIKLLVGV